jgi:PAS domain S-box-containing protein
MLGTISIMTAAELHHPTLLTMLCNLIDSIERELQLRKNNRQLHMLNQIMIESTRNGIIVTDTDGCVTEFNEFAEKLTGIKKEEILGKSVKTIQPAGRYIDELLKNGNKYEDVELIFEETADRVRTICLFDVLPIFDEKSVLAGAFGQFRDITETFEAKEEAEKASKAKSEFLSSMSHELRTPLNAILGFAQLLEFETEDPLSDTQLDDVREIMKAGNHLLELINEILDLSRIETNKLQVTLNSVEVNPLLEECLSLIQPIAESKKISISWHPTALNVAVSADRTRLKQAIINLLTNAIKYNKLEGSVTVIGKPVANNRYKLSVIDTGYGIDESEIAYIFQPFHRLAKHSAIEGTGIGLSITKQLIDLMGGKIGVNSKISHGSEFWIELNKVVDGASDALGGADGFEQLGAAKEKVHTILYVEDNQANLALVSRILKGHPDLRLLSAPNAETGIEMATKHRPDLILMDINLPDMSGFEAFKCLRNMEGTKEIPVIAISANAMPTDIKQGTDLGFLKYITKPISVPHFMEDIQDVLKGESAHEN